MTVAAIYSRKSTDQTGVADDQRSVTRQVEHAKDYATMKAWRVDDQFVYVDDNVSGAEFANRPGFVRMMAALKPRAPFDVLIMSEESRLGRESIETAFALKQLVQADVRVFFYLEDRERTLDSPTDKIMMSLTAFADELEREKARQRTYDAMLAKAKAGHVTGGRVFGYDNVRVNSHVERRINDTEAATVRRIFELCGAGNGYTRIAKALNAEGAPTPRPQQGRPAGWAPTSIKEVLDRRLYIGEVVWNKTRKRDRWGQHRTSDRPESEWLRQSAPALRIVSEPIWNAAQSRLAAIRSRLDTTGRRRRDVESRYLLSGFARCGLCGGSFFPVSRSHGKQRRFFYACGAHYKRGPHVCENALVQSMEQIDDAVLRAIGGDVLRPAVIMAIVDGVIAKLSPTSRKRTIARHRKDLAQVDRETTNLTKAIAAGGPIDPLVAELKACQERRDGLVSAIDAAEGVDLRRFDRKAIERTVRQELTQWRSLLTGNVGDGRQLLREVLVGPLTFTPEGDVYRFEGEAGVGKLLSGKLPLMWRPQRDGNTTSISHHEGNCSDGCRA